MTNDDELIDKDELVTVYTVTDAVEAEILKNFLNAEGVKCDIDGEGQAGFTGAVEIGILVRAIDADRAESLIRSREPKPEEDKD
ncbi:MAG: DUF2007 domain-containing protein [Pirellulales bacterium]|nr:DUF2007 domain-containing protein [Pirellulales bacterium]